MKHALVTGGSGDIGQAIAGALAKAGHFVYVHANQRYESAQQVVDNIIADGGLARAIQFDVTDRVAVTMALESMLQTAPIQILVNNAGIHEDAVMAGMRGEQWDRVLDVNLNGFFNVTQPLLLPMIRTRWGRIINMASIAGVMGNRGQANYAASKAGLIGASKSMAQEMGSRGITVNVVAPGIIEGSMTQTVFDKEAIKRLVPMARAGRADEVAAVVGFLASDAAAYVSGQVIGVNGAMA
ncbi:MAG: 3-oxoacyl-ACP reductase FabG [Gammaproteobacteria bacterium]